MLACIVVRSVLITLVALFAGGPLTAVPTERLYLSGRGPSDAVSWHFRCDQGRGCGDWTTIPVPSNWELQGFGHYDYGLVRKKARDRGHYRTFFHLPAAWRDRHIRIVFDGVMTDATVRLNGALAGPPHRGGFYRFGYDVTDLVLFGAANVLDVTVDEHSADSSVNEAERDSDYWTFGGIYRPVRLEARPAEAIEGLAVDARHDGSFTATALLAGIRTADTIEARIEPSAGGEPLAVLRAALAPGDSEARLQGRVAGVEPWSAEHPRLYRLVVTLSSSAGMLHREVEQIGFRTMEARPGEGLFLNGRKIRLKGVNRHSFWPDTGRATDVAVSRLDAGLIKAMNANAVRTSHYPPDEHFLTACDQAGLYVLDELAGWHDPYDTAVGRRLVEEMVVRDRNHPSVVLWANGNEGGWNLDLDDDFRRFDPQGRPLLHPRRQEPLFDTSHYPTWAELEASLDDSGLAGLVRRWRRQPPPIYLPTEILHGLYDGGHGAGLETFWNRLRSSPSASGLFLWALVDEAVVRTDLDGILDSDGNHAPDGILGPHREPEGSVDAVREVWSPVALSQPPRFDSEGATLRLENRYDFTDLAVTTARWRLVDLPGPWDHGDERVVATGAVSGPTAAPGAEGALRILLPPGWRGHDALAIEIEEPAGRAVIGWTFLLTPVAPTADAAPTPSVPPLVERDDLVIRMQAGAVQVEIDTTTGLLAAIAHGGATLPLVDGPRHTSGPSRLVALTSRATDDAGIVIAAFDGPLEEVVWRLRADGWLEAGYRYRPDAAAAFDGLGFGLPAAAVRSARWLGRGPYRVWGNRLAGRLGLWSLAANHTITGVSWDYPEFAGYRAQVQWIRLDTTGGEMVLTADPNLPFVQLLRPGEWPDPQHATAPFPDLGISFLRQIPAIGTKFHPAIELAPTPPPAPAAEPLSGRLLIGVRPEPGEAG